MSIPLIKSISHPQALRAAWNEINRSNPLSHGLSPVTIETFGKHLEKNLKEIKNELKSDSFRFSPVRGTVLKKDGKKPRPLRIAEIRDRVVQRAITRKIEPILSSVFQLQNPASFAYIKGRGSQDAFAKMLNYYEQNNPVVLKADILKFFDTVDRDILMNFILDKLPDASLNSLIISALTQEIGNIETLSEFTSLFPNAGIPQGGGLSPLFANVYLYNFDKIMLKNGFNLIRYADDFIVMCKDKSEANLAYEKAKEILEGELKLKIHDLKENHKTKILKITQESFEFLGIRFNGRKLWPGQEKMEKFQDKIASLTKFSDDKNLLQVLNNIKYFMDGWVSAYSFCDIRNILKKMDDELKVRLGRLTKRMGWCNKDKLSNRAMRFSGLSNYQEKLGKMRTTNRNLSSFYKYWEENNVVRGSNASRKPTVV